MSCTQATEDSTLTRSCSDYIDTLKGGVSLSAKDSSDLEQTNNLPALLKVCKDQLAALPEGLSHEPQTLQSFF